MPLFTKPLSLTTLTPPHPSCPLSHHPPPPPSPQAFLSRALEPPSARAVHNARLLLHQVGALDPATDALTPLGRHLAHLPVDPLVGKMIVLGTVFGCLEPVLVIAAGLAQRDPWVVPPPEMRREAEAVRAFLAGGALSDHVALQRAYESWSALGTVVEREEFCRRSFLRSSTLQQMQDTVLQFAELLADAGFLTVGRGYGGDGEGGRGMSQ